MTPEESVRLGKVEMQADLIVARLKSEEGHRLERHKEVVGRLTTLETSLHGNGGPGVLTKIAVAGEVLKVVDELRGKMVWMERRFLLAMGIGMAVIWFLEYVK